MEVDMFIFSHFIPVIISFIIPTRLKALSSLSKIKTLFKYTDLFVKGLE